MKVGDKVKLVRVHGFHPIVITCNLNKTGVIVDKKDDTDAIKVQFGEGKIAHWMKSEYFDLEKIK